MKRTLAAALPVLAVASLTLTAAPATAQHTGTATRTDDATVTLRPNTRNGVSTGISGTLRIDGREVRGSATGLNPARRYITLYYGDLSTAQPGQGNTCADPRTAAQPRSWGVAPEWRVRDGGVGRLRAVAARRVTTEPVAMTASIREVPARAGADPYATFTPVDYPVVACGRIVRR